MTTICGTQNVKTLSNDYGTQCRTGAVIANAVVMEMTSKGNPLLLRQAIAKILDDRNADGVKIGFIQHLATRLMGTAPANHDGYSAEATHFLQTLTVRDTALVSNASSSNANPSVFAKWWREEVAA